MNAFPPTSQKILRRLRRAGLLGCFVVSVTVSRLGAQTPTPAVPASDPASLPQEATPNLTASAPSNVPLTDADPGSYAMGATSGPAPAESAPSGRSDSPDPANSPALVAAAPASSGDTPAEGTVMIASDDSAPAPARADAPASPAPSENVTVNLIHLMVKRGLISKSDAEGLIKQAEDEAMAAHEQALVARAKSEPSASGPAANETSPAQEAGAQGTPAVAADDDTVRVTYVPDVVKQQLRDEIKQDVMAEARDENWGPETQVPDWVHRFHVTGDIRVRTEGDFFPPGNDNTGGFPNFNSINTGSGFDVNPNNSATAAIPYYNVDQDRDRLRLRARIGAGIDLGEGFTAGLRVGSGQDNNPVTENQTLGLANNAQGGDFSKYQVWIDRAFINYDLWGQPDKDLSVTVGRFDNPFFSTPMIWANDIGFDGFMAKGKYEVAPGITPFLTGGIFPVFNTDFNFATDNSAKFNSTDKWLFAAQGGSHFKINDDFNFLGAVAIYDFEDVQGHLSNELITPNSTNEAGSTDDERPSFAQNGNTYTPLRNFAALNPTTSTIPEDQYYGLASGFQELALTGQLDFSRFDPIHAALVGEFVDNLAFDRNYVASVAVNNGSNGGIGYEGGNQGYYAGIVFGDVALEKRWDWNVNLNYRYVESDSVIDGFTDSDFGGDLTGTNLKGYTLQGDLALAQRVWLRLTYMSADAIAGPPFENDLIMFDINAKF
jgi:hypothetical protein